MIRRRTVLLYNLGLVLTLIVCGMLTTYALSLLGDFPGAEAVHASMQAKAAKDILEEEDPDRLRATATFYLKLSQDLKRARYDDNLSGLEDVRYGCFLIAALFAVGALLGFASAKPGEKSAREIRQEPSA